jgi:hypothetical protein
MTCAVSAEKISERGWGKSFDIVTVIYIIMRVLFVLVAFALVVPQILSFAPNEDVGQLNRKTRHTLSSRTSLSCNSDDLFFTSAIANPTTQTTTASMSNHKNLVARTFGMLTALSVVPSALAVVAAEDAYEIAELPPVYVPVIFGVGLLIGVGLLTGSLGDVIDEESQLGMQSGARAQKEKERSRSSYFKKK